MDENWSVPLDIINDCKGIRLNCIFAEEWRSQRNLGTLSINSVKIHHIAVDKVIQKYPKKSFVVLEHEADITSHLIYLLEWVNLQFEVKSSSENKSAILTGNLQKTHTISESLIAI
jgi:hypothetical protein